MRTLRLVSTSITLALLACMACKPNDASIGHDPVRERDAALFQPKVFDAGIDTPDARDANDDDVSDAFVPAALPPVDDACAVDADCDVVLIELSGPMTCCGRCGSTAGNRAWKARVTAICAKAPPSPFCPVLDCPAGPMHARCVSGKCVGVF